MKKTFTIDVMQEDIDHGEKRKCRKCPVALAVSRATGRESHVGHFVIVVAGTKADVHTPEIARQFMMAFDQDYFVRPFSFPLTLDLPEAA